jgi:ABC-type transport system involved in multi-copper enzyme maturation permease subunit
MWAKALWSREYAQARLFVWGVPVIHFLALGFGRLNQWILDPAAVGRAERYAGSGDILAAYQNGDLESFGRVWLLLAVCVLALVQFGTERRNGSQEFLFSLPYSRRRIFFTKWLFGASLIAGSLVLNTAIDMIVVAASPMAPLFSLNYHLTEIGYSAALLLAAYSAAVLIGTVTGTAPSQSVFLVLLGILPIGTYALLDESVRIMWNDRGFPDTFFYEELQDALNLSHFFFLQHDFVTWQKTFVFLLLAAALAAGGMWSYERNKPENNGKLILFGWLELVCQIGAIALASMFCGMIGAGLIHAGEARIGYAVGFAAGFAVSLLATSRLRKVRLKT